MDNKEMIEILIKKLEEKEQGIESNLNTYNNLLNELTDVYDSLEEIDINDYEETYNILRKIADKYHINYFVVNRQYRKQGIGTALMNEIYKIAKQNNVSKVELMVTNKNSNAVMFYQNQNFKIERLLLCKEI